MYDNIVVRKNLLFEILAAWKQKPEARSEYYRHRQCIAQCPNRCVLHFPANNNHFEITAI